MSSVRRPKTVKNMNVVFDKLKVFIKDNEFDIKAVAEGLDQILKEFYAVWNEITEETVAGIESTWEGIMDEAKHDDGARIQISKLFNEMLDDLLGKDFFGTEGQCDPRGDHRN